MANYLAVLSLVCIVKCGVTQIINVSSGKTTCDQLPKLPILSIEDFVNHGPFTYDFSCIFFLCTTQIITVPPRGTSGLSGISAFIQGSKVTVLEFKVVDEVTIQGTSCNSGKKLTFHFAAVEANSNGAFYCAYTCNGPAILDYSCASTNNTEFLQQELAAIEVAKTVPNGDKIHPARENCPPSNCRAF